MIIEEFKKRVLEKIMANNLQHLKITVNVKSLKPEEVLGKPSRRGFPLCRGREVMVQAELDGSIGQAYTDEPADYDGSIISACALPLTTNRNRAIFIATANALYKHLGLISNSKHCKDEGPEICGRKVAEHLRREFPPETKIVMIGFQPAIAHHVSSVFKNFRVTDMDQDNIGQVREGVLIESHKMNKEAIAWSDVTLATGSTMVNGTIDEIVESCKGKRLIFYGVTIASAAQEFNFERLCFASS